jgi:hypothetical protein
MSSNNSGNQTFTRVVNVASPIDELCVGKLITPTSVTSGEVVGYLPSGAAAVGSYWLNNTPNAVANTTTAYNATTLVLPLGAAIQKVVVISGSVDLAGGGNIDIGPQAFGSVASTANTLFNDVTSTTINASGGAIVGVTLSAFGSAGTQAGVVTSLTALTGITLTPSAAITDGASQLQVRISYVV